MEYYQIAGLMVAVSDAGEDLKNRMKEYKTDRSEADILLHIREEDLKNMKMKYPTLTIEEWEYIMTGNIFNRRIPDFNGFCLHSSAVALEGKAILFSGPCGTGKSTHTNLWQQLFGSDNAVIINDDKPVLRRKDNAFCVYGTPWSGKSSLNTNICVPLGAIVFLKQADENKILRLSSREAVQLILYQSVHPGSRDGMEKYLALIDQLLQTTPVYQLECNISFDAVKMVYDEIYQMERMV